MKEKTQVDKWLNKLKNKKSIAILVILFTIFFAGMKFANEYLKLQDNLSSTNKENANKQDTALDTLDSGDYRVLPKKDTDSQTQSNEETKRKESAEESLISIVSGRLIDSNGVGISKGTILIENGAKTITDNDGYFKIILKKRVQQVKVKIRYSKEGLGSKERYIGVNQNNVILRL